MARNGSGTYSLPAGNPVTTGSTISSSWANTTLSDIASALTGSIAADGQTTPTANLLMGTYAHTNVGNATARTMYASAGQVQDSTLTYLTSVSGTNAITASAPIVMTAYAAGQTFRFIAAAANTGATTININSIGLKSITRDGTTALVAGDIVSGGAYQLIYDGTQFQLTNSSNASVQVTSFSAGTTGLTPSTATTGAITLGGTLNVANGGTGVTTSTGSGANVLGTGPTITGAALNGTLGATTPSTVAATTISASGKITQNGTAGFEINNGSVLGELKYSGGLVLNRVAGSSFFIAQNNNNEVIVDTSGNLGLGVTPSAWQSTRKAYQVGVSSLSTINNNTFVGTNFYSDGTSKYIGTGVALLYGQESSGAHTWYNSASGTAGNAITFTQAMTLDASGNLGLGTTSSPWQGNFRAMELGAAGSGISTNASGKTILAANYYFSLGDKFAATGFSTIYQQDSGNHYWGASTASGTAGGAITFTSGMYLNASSRLLLAATAFPTGTSASFTSGGGDVYLNGNLYLGNTTGTAGQTPRIDGFSNQLYCIWSNSSGVDQGGLYLSYGGTSWTAVSDERQKDIIEPITDAANKVMSLRAVIGKYKNDDENTRRSFLIAQDVQAVLPEAVTSSKTPRSEDETEYLGIQYTDVIPLLVAAIKEQQAMIDELKTKVAALEAK